jgi:hypothetical protein
MLTRVRTAVVNGVVAGLIAGVPQVLLTQIETGVFGLPREQADIGPRFVRRVAQRVIGRAPSPPTEWLLATVFHFGYAAQWGGLYALSQVWRPTPPLVGGPMLGALIYALAFSPWGAATQTGTERPSWRRPTRETLMHWTAALSIGLTTAYVFDWLRRRESLTTSDTSLQTDLTSQPSLGHGEGEHGAAAR